MNACLLKIAADELKEMAAVTGKEDIVRLCDEVSKDTYDSLQKNAWIGGWFARCLINDDRPYKYLGSTGDGLSLDENVNGTYYLNSFSWTLLADVASEEQTTEMLEKIEKYLKSGAGLKLVTPVDYDKLGIVTGSSFYFPGDRENGAVFKHAAMMCTVACLRKAKTVNDTDLSGRLKDLAFFMIDRTLPYKTMEDPYVLKGNPRFCTQYNNSQTGEGIGPILSGTSSWLTLAMYEILGMDIHEDVLHIDPILNTDEYTYTLKVKDTPIDIRIKKVNDFKTNDKTICIYDGKETGRDIPLPDDGQIHRLEILL